MTKEEFTNELRRLSEKARAGDAEMPHIEADELVAQWLRETGCEEAADIFDKMPKWLA